MKYVKMFGLLAVVAASLMAFVGVASATTTTAPGNRLQNSEHITAHSTHTQLSASFGTVTCEESTITGTVTTAGATSGHVTLLTFDKCGNDTVTVLSGGNWGITSAGTFSSTGMKITIVTHKTIFGFPVTTHCVYSTSGTDLGTLVEGTNPELSINSVPIQDDKTSDDCTGGTLSGTYDFTNHYLAVD